MDSQAAVLLGGISLARDALIDQDYQYALEILTAHRDDAMKRLEAESKMTWPAYGTDGGMVTASMRGE